MIQLLVYSADKALHVLQQLGLLTKEVPSDLSGVIDHVDDRLALAKFPWH